MPPGIVRCVDTIVIRQTIRAGGTEPSRVERLVIPMDYREVLRSTA